MARLCADIPSPSPAPSFDYADMPSPLGESEDTITVLLRPAQGRGAPIRWESEDQAGVVRIYGLGPSPAPEHPTWLAPFGFPYCTLSLSGGNMVGKEAVGAGDALQAVKEAAGE